jgi:hypothetical protein
VVRDDVEHLAEPVLRELVAHALVRFGPSELDVHRSEVDDVVAVRAPLRRLQIGRGVEVRHAELGEVARDLRGAIEAETRMQLHPVSRPNGSCLAGFFHGPAPTMAVRQ